MRPHPICLAMLVAGCTPPAKQPYFVYVPYPEGTDPQSVIKSLKEVPAPGTTVAIEPPPSNPPVAPPVMQPQPAQPENAAADAQDAAPGPPPVEQAADPPAPSFDPWGLRSLKDQ